MTYKEKVIEEFKEEFVAPAPFDDGCYAIKASYFIDFIYQALDNQMGLVMTELENEVDDYRFSILEEIFKEKGLI